MSSLKKAIILLSGGLDSATALAIAKSQGYECYCLSFSYGQRHAIELDRAKQVAHFLGASEHKIAEIDLRLFGGSALTSELAVPKHDRVEEIGTDIPVTYVPARNTIFLSFALGWAEVIGAWDIFIGVNALDYSGYPDCRPDFIAAYESMSNLALAAAVEGKGAMRIHTPLINMSKADIIRMGLALGVEYDMTISCYDPAPDGTPCGHCDSCLLRAKGFAEVNGG